MFQKPVFVLVLATMLWSHNADAAMKIPGQGTYHQNRALIPVQGLSMDDLNNISSGISNDPDEAAKGEAPLVTPFNPVGQQAAQGKLPTALPTALPDTAPPVTTAPSSLDTIMPPPGDHFGGDLKMPDLPGAEESPAAPEGQQTIRPASNQPSAAPKQSSEQGGTALSGTGNQSAAPATAARGEDKTAKTATAKSDTRSAKTSDAADDREPPAAEEAAEQQNKPVDFDPTAAAMNGVVLSPDDIQAATGRADVDMQPVRVTTSHGQTGVDAHAAAQSGTQSGNLSGSQKSGAGTKSRATMNNMVSAEDEERAKAAVPKVEPTDSQDAKDRHVHGKHKGRGKKSRSTKTRIISQNCTPPDLRLETIPGARANTYRLRGVIKVPTEGYYYEINPTEQRSSFIAPEGGPALMSMTLSMKRPGEGYHRANGTVMIDTPVTVASATKRLDVVVNNIFGRRSTVYYCRIPGSLE